MESPAVGPKGTQLRFAKGLDIEILGARVGGLFVEVIIHNCAVFIPHGRSAHFSSFSPPCIFGKISQQEGVIRNVTQPSTGPRGLSACLVTEETGIMWCTFFIAVRR